LKKAGEGEGDCSRTTAYLLPVLNDQDIQFTLVWSGVSDALRTILSDLLRDFACAGINRAWSRGFIAGAGEDRWSD
jgi:hypothetical protein